MNIYVVRHSEAEYIGSGPGGERQLTGEGRRLIETSASNWLKFITPPGVILSSPALRTRQTMDVIIETLRFEGEKTIARELQGGTPITEIYELLGTIKVENIMLVMHEPETSLFIADACGGGSLEVYFKPGTIAKIAFPGKARSRAGKLHFFIPPDIFD